LFVFLFCHGINEGSISYHERRGERAMSQIVRGGVWMIFHQYKGY
jgi:hypothetical protein